ncbi:LOW QUALITY PROTEIN: uncharacterized protein LOC142536410 [Primulina tabacum]|uniref:LOW QUALITY PROTEIN: uncharacterized protein LOC142536410 n=1 Tax=Primulina tabacum TaxID=48773 RepID=UPI003F59DED2
MEEHHHLHQPLVQPSNATAPSYSVTVIDFATTPRDEDSDHDSRSSFSITFRISFIALLALVSLWANHEAYRGFSVTVINEAGETIAGKRFHLFYVSNDEATRILIKASKAVETFLYTDNDMDSKKEVARVIFKLKGSNSSDEVVVDSERVHEFVLNISPSILEGTDFKRGMFLAVQQGVARVWLWDGQGQSPKYLINGIVEYITNNLDGFGRLPPSLEEAAPLQKGFSSAACWKSQDPRAVAEFLKHCERHQPGFIARLNRGMKYVWHDDMFGVALGLPVQDLCTSFESLRYNFSSF